MKVLTDPQIQQFITDGYVKVENAFPSALAEEARAILWKDLPGIPNDPTTWTQPVIRLGEYSQEPFRQAANSSILHQAFDQLVGYGKWLPRHSLGAFPIRFPSEVEPGDDGWHVDASFPGDDPANYMSWRINVRSKGRALLMLFLFSDIDAADAPTRIRVGSHLDVVKILEPFGEAGLSFLELAGQLENMPYRRQVLATGKAGTVYLCHPHIAHAAQPHHGHSPRFMAQPPLLSSEHYSLHRDDRNYSPVEIAIRKGMGFI